MSIDECSPEPQGDKSSIILDPGSDVSLLPMHSRTRTPKNHNLRDRHGQQLHTSFTKDAELVVNDLDNSQAILRQQFIVGDVRNCRVFLGQLMRRGWTIGKTSECASGIA